MEKMMHVKVIRVGSEGLKNAEVLEQGTYFGTRNQIQAMMEDRYGPDRLLIAYRF